MTTIPDKDARCRAVESLIASGKGVGESCRIVGISERTLAPWRKTTQGACRTTLIENATQSGLVGSI
ncbi:MAG: hypothetical protein BVN32_11155 [Proteobacteria bacterium ST_bin14]|nr:MAG: hypothetical protein BVN32_11155 [Proteobacteria bacterium ST_bin14]